MNNRKFDIIDMDKQEFLKVGGGKRVPKHFKILKDTLDNNFKGLWATIVAIDMGCRCEVRIHHPSINPLGPTGLSNCLHVYEPWVRYSNPSIRNDLWTFAGKLNYQRLPNKNNRLFFLLRDELMTNVEDELDFWKISDKF